MHLEFVVVGVPISNQSPGNTLTNWKASVEAEARRNWTAVPLERLLKAIIINMYSGDAPTLDLDNMSKPILDVMQRLVYEDDRQVRQVELAHIHIYAPHEIVGVSKLLVDNIRSGRDVVYVRIENTVEPYPLPQERS